MGYSDSRAWLVVSVSSGGQVSEDIHLAREELSGPAAGFSASLTTTMDGIANTIWLAMRQEHASPAADLGWFLGGRENAINACLPMQNSNPVTLITHAGMAY